MRPALVFWEDWDGEWRDYRMIDDAAYRVGDCFLRPDGFPALAGMPDPLNRVLFRNSRLYQYLAMSFSQRPGLGEREVVAEFAEQRLVEVLALTRSVGAQLILFLAPHLDRPFAETDASPPVWHTVLLEFARAHDIPAIALQHELVDRDYEAVRIDPCCHFNAEGHRDLVPGMQRLVLARLDGAEAQPR